MSTFLSNLPPSLRSSFCWMPGKGGDGSGVVIHSSTASTNSWRGKRQRRAGVGGHRTGDPAVDTRGRRTVRPVSAILTMLAGYFVCGCARCRRVVSTTRAITRVFQTRALPQSKVVSHTQRRSLGKRASWRRMRVSPVFSTFTRRGDIHRSPWMRRGAMPRMGRDEARVPARREANRWL